MEGKQQAGLLLPFRAAKSDVLLDSITMSRSTPRS